MHCRTDSPRDAWAIFFGGIFLATGTAAAVWFQGVEYGALVTAFGLTVVAGGLGVVRFGFPRLRTTDVWVLALAATLVVAVFAARVFYLSAGAALGLWLFFGAYAFCRAVPASAVTVPLGWVGGLGVALGASVVTAHLAANTDIAGPFVYRHLLSLFVLAAGFALMSAAAESRARTLVAIVAGFVPFLLVGLAGSRGVLIAGAAATGACLAVSRLRAQAWCFTAAAGAGLALAAALNPQLVERASTLLAPAEVASSRVVLWASILPLLVERPLVGHGPGLLFAVWPPFRDFADGTAGYYAHNGFLDFAVTAGIPSAILLAAVFRSLLHAGIRAATAPSTWLVGGVVAIAVHALGDFSLLAPSVWLLFGAIAGALAGHAPAAPAWTRPAARLSVACGGMVLAVLLAYAAASGYAQALLSDADEAVERGEPIVALAAIDRASRWWPASDVPAVERAALVTSTVLTAPSAADNPLFGQALSAARADVNRALLINPLRPDTYRLAARIEIAAGTAGDEHAFATARAYLQRALATNPRAVAARVELADLLESRGRFGDAWVTLENGLIHPIRPRTSRPAYLARTERAERLFYERELRGGGDAREN